MKTLIALAVVILTTSSGCATSAFYKDVSAGQIGCTPEDIEIGEVSSGLRTQTWPATCKNEKFICNSISSHGMGSNQVTCKKAI